MEANRKKLILFAHIIDGNLGDRAACPTKHFVYSEAREVDFRSVTTKDLGPVIIGGGGMLHPGVDSWISATSSARPSVAWGVGLNYHDDFDANRKKASASLRRVNLVGVRNRKFAEENGFRYVPCPSCMHPSLDARHGEKKRSVGVYEHYRMPIVGYPGAERMNNRADKYMRDAVEFLATSEKIVTNSYHGAFWCHLMRVPCEIVPNGSNRFEEMPDEDITQCRLLNIEFNAEVQKWLNALK